MSNKSFIVQYIIKARDKFSASANKFSRSIKKIGKQLDATRKKFKKFTDATKKAGQKMTAVAAVVSFAILRFGGRFQDSMADLSAITGATGKDLDKLQSNIFRLAKASATSSAEVAEAFKLVASAKPELLKNLDALTATTEQVLLLKNAAGIELASAANIAAQGLNIFGAGADQASRFVNVLAAGAKLGGSEIAETGAAMLLAGPAARAAGLNFEQLNAAIQVTALGGIKAERAGTALNAIFGRLQREGKKLTGVELDFQKLGLEGTFRVVKRALDAQTSSTARARFASKIFGEEHSKVGFAILNNIKLLGQLEKNVTGTNIAQEQAAIRLATFNAKARKTGAIIKEVLIKVFLKLAPVLIKIIEGIGDFVTWLTKLSPATKTIILGFSAFLAVMGPVLLGLSVLSATLPFLIAGFGLLKIAVMAAFGPIGLAIAGVVAGVTLIVANWEKITKFFGFGKTKIEASEKRISEINARSRVDVGVRVGLDKGLKQTSEPIVVGLGARRADIGMATP